MRQAFLDLLLERLRWTGGGAGSVANDDPIPTPNPHPPFTVLLALRADFMAPALAYRPLADAIQQCVIVVGPTNSFELRQAVEQPVLSRGVRFEPGLVERLLSDVGSDPGNLPLLQFCLTQLWGRQRADTLTHAAYEDLGGLAGALSRYADRVFAQLTPEEQDEARQALTRLVQPGEGTEDTRRWASRQELGEGGWLVVRHLADTRLVVTDRNADGREQASLAHETLLRHWDRLRDWLQEDLTSRLWRQRLTPWLQQWVASGQDTAFLLRGLLLAEAEQWSDEQLKSFSELEHSFITASSDQHG